MHGATRVKTYPAWSLKMVHWKTAGGTDHCSSPCSYRIWRRERSESPFVDTVCVRSTYGACSVCPVLVNHTRISGSPRGREAFWHMSHSPYGTSFEMSDTCTDDQRPRKPGDLTQQNELDTHTGSSQPLSWLQLTTSAGYCVTGQSLSRDSGSRGLSSRRSVEHHQSAPSG